MKQMRNRLTALLLAGRLLALCCLTACGNQNSGDADVSPSGSAPAETDGETVTITDMAGRTVTFPKNPEKVFSASPASEAWLCALVPDRLIGWSNTMTDQQLSYYPEEVSDIPLVGGWYGYTEGNAEGIITMAPGFDKKAGDEVEIELRWPFAAPRHEPEWIVQVKQASLSITR